MQKKINDLRSRTTLTSVQNEMAKPRMSKSARIAERKLETAQISDGVGAADKIMRLVAHGNRRQG
jgi:hypothetical protein